MRVSALGQKQAPMDENKRNSGAHFFIFNVIGLSTKSPILNRGATIRGAFGCTKAITLINSAPIV